MRFSLGVASRMNERAYGLCSQTSTSRCANQISSDPDYFADARTLAGRTKRPAPPGALSVRLMARSDGLARVVVRPYRTQQRRR